MFRNPLVAGILAIGVGTSALHAQPVIFATGEFLTPGAPGEEDILEDFVFEIDLLTGVATPISPATESLPTGLAGTPTGELFGFGDGQLSELNPTTGTQTNIGANNGLDSTAFDITASGQGFILPFDNFTTRQLNAIDLTDGTVTPLGSANAVGDAIDAASGDPADTARPFIINLGSVGDSLYSVDLQSGSLLSFDGMNGGVSVVGAVGAVREANGGGFSGFSALTGVDEDLDGTFDALIGSVNFIGEGDDIERIGGVARFDLSTGGWSMIGTNPGIAFFGFGSSPIPTPGSVALLAAGGLFAARRRR